MFLERPDRKIDRRFTTDGTAVDSEAATVESCYIGVGKGRWLYSEALNTVALKLNHLTVYGVGREL